jgi:hypothetical protein
MGGAALAVPVARIVGCMMLERCVTDSVSDTWVADFERRAIAAVGRVKHRLLLHLIYAGLACTVLWAAFLFYGAFRLIRFLI